MGTNSAISWTHHTLNFWRGCTKVGPGCDFCYAEGRDLMYESGKDAAEAAHWGAGKPRALAAAATRNAPFKWERDVAKTGKYLVFAHSLSDVFDNEVDPTWRSDLWGVIRKTPHLRYQIVTKRIGNADKMLPEDFETAFPHVGIMSTVVTQQEADRDVPKLLALKLRRRIPWVGLSIEPQLEEINLRHWIYSPAPYLDWVITGGESYQIQHAKTNTRPRPYHVEWARSLIAQTRGTRTAMFVKQLGANAFMDGQSISDSNLPSNEPAGWPEDVRVQELPELLQP